jgi:hypothetical protein
MSELEAEVVDAGVEAGVEAGVKAGVVENNAKKTSSVVVNKKKSFDEFLKSMIQANMAFGLDKNNVPDKLNIFNKLFNVGVDVTVDDIGSMKEAIKTNIDKFRVSNKTENSSSEGNADADAASREVGDGSGRSGFSRLRSFMGRRAAAPGAPPSEGGGKRRRSIKRKHRSIRTIL